MVFLLNLLFALLAFFFVRYAMEQVGADRPVAVIVAILMAVVVFFANIASQVI